MKNLIRLIFMLLSVTILPSCDNDLYDGSKFSFSNLYISFEDESGENVTKNINLTEESTDTTSYPFYDVKVLFGNDYYRSDPYSISRIDGRLQIKFIHHHPIIKIKANICPFDNDTEKIEFVGTQIKENKYMYYEWEFKGKALSIIKKSDETYVTLIRHDDGTYSLKE